MVIANEYFARKNEIRRHTGRIYQHATIAETIMQAVHCALGEPIHLPKR